MKLSESLLETDGWLRCVRADGAGSVDDDDDIVVIASRLASERGMGAGELGTNVGEDSGTLVGDAVADHEDEQPGEEIVDIFHGFKMGDAGEKFGGEVFGIGFGVTKTGMAKTEAGVGVQGRKAAEAALASTMAATCDVAGRL